MTSPDLRQQLANITRSILSEELDFLDLKNGLDRFKDLCLQATGIDLESDAASEYIKLDSGKAIGPRWAGMCIEDLLRTRRFQMGVLKAVTTLLDKQQEPIQILYAGTGPFATLVLPLISLFSSEQIQFTLLEVNPVSFENVKLLFRRMQAEDYLANTLQCDASEVKLKAPELFDIVVIECLQHKLEREPQVAITQNLLSQLREDVVLIPEDISLYVSYINMSARNEQMMSGSTGSKKDYYRLANPIFRLNKKTTYEMSNGNGQLEPGFPEEYTEIAKQDKKPGMSLAIATEIRVFDDELLQMDDCGLTVPNIIADLDHAGYDLNGLHTRYVLGNHPGLRIEFSREACDK